MTKIIIAGGRNFYDYNLLYKKCSEIIEKRGYKGIQIVSGACKGADILGEKFAREKGYPVARFEANWSLGQSAGNIRNGYMAEYADALIIFWDGASKGSKNMIKQAEKHNLLINVVRYDQK